MAPHIPCGIVKPETLCKLADVAEKYGAQALKITPEAIKLIEKIDEYYKTNARPNQRLDSMIGKMVCHEFKSEILQ